MNCRTFIDGLDEYRDGTLSSREHRDAVSHLRGCPACQQRLESVQALSAALRELPAPAARPGFLDDALARAQGPRVSHRMRWTYMTGAALAASLALWIGASRLPDLLHESVPKPIGVTIALNETRTIQLAFNAEHELRQATLSLTLPEGVELQGFPGQRQVRWQTDLAVGANVLALPLIAVSPTEGALLARLEHGDRSTEFTVPLHVNDAARSSALPSKLGKANLRPSTRKEVPNANA